MKKIFVSCPNCGPTEAPGGNACPKCGLVVGESYSIDVPDVDLSINNGIGFLDWYAKVQPWLTETANMAVLPIPDTPEQMWIVNRNLAARLVYVGTLRANAKSYLKEAIGRETERVIDKYSGKKIQPTQVKDIAEACAKNEIKVYEFVERIGATLTHYLDSLRTEISMQKSIYQNTPRS